MRVAWSRTNYLSQSCLWSHLDERLHLYLHLSACGGYIYIYIYTYIYTHAWICMYEFMNKKCFSRHIWIHACACLWTKSGFPDLPFQGSHKLAVCTDSVICSVTKGGSSLLILCVLVCCVIFYLEIFFSHFHKKHTISVCAFLYDTGWLSLKEELRIRLTPKYCNMHKIMCGFC